VDASRTGPDGDRDRGRVVRTTCSTATSILVTNGAPEDREPGASVGSGIRDHYNFGARREWRNCATASSRAASIVAGVCRRGINDHFLRQRATSNRYDREIAVPNRIILLVSASNVPCIAPTLPTFGLNSFSCRSARYPSECRS
jgi:hypothetical protein